MRVVVSRNSQRCHYARVIGRPNSRRAIGGVVADEMDIVDADPSAQQHQVDPQAEIRGHIHDVGILAASQPRIRRAFLLPGINQAGIDECLVGRKRRIRRHVGRNVEITDKRDRQGRRIDRALQGLGGLRQLER
jgi:hypothetical protein